MSPVDHTNTSDVMADSHASRDLTTSDFDPDHEALVSTRQLDNSHRQRLPNRAKPRDVQTDPEAEPDFAIDTSALHRAFPDFSDASSSEEEDDISIEMGRGGKKPLQRLDDSRDSVMSVDDSRYSASPVVRGDRFSNSPHRAALRSIPNRGLSARDSLRKDAQIRRASLALKNNNVPQDARNKSGSQRRTLSEMHAKASEAYDGSYVSDERPANITSTTRNTRFGSMRQGAKVVDAVNKAAGKPYLKHHDADVDRGELRRQPVAKTAENNATADNLTHQSFALPDIPNLSDLVSGIYEDGTPKGRSRTTRFTSPPAVGTAHRQRHEHFPLDSIPVPDDEKAIFISLKLLQEKLEALQMDKSDMERRLEEIEEENMILKSENTRWQKQDKNLRMYGGDEDINDGRRNGNHSVQRSRLEAANSALQNRLDIFTRKISSHETRIQHLIQERDSARTQLGVAYLNLQELKLENDVLGQENDELKIQLESLTEYPEATYGKQHKQTHDSKTIGRGIATRDQIETTETNRTRPARAVESLDADASVRKNAVDAQRQNSHNIHTRQQKQTEYDELFSLDLSHLSVQQHTRHTKTRANTTEKKLPNTSKQRTKKPIIEYSEDIELSEGEMGTETRGFRYRNGPANDLTFLSFIDANEIAQLRKTLEEERVARNNRLNRDFTEQSKISNLTLRTSGNFKQSAPLKSLLKNAVSRDGRTVTVEVPGVDITEQGAAANTTRDLSQRIDTRRRQKRTEEMTSAFILPDITMHGVTAKPGEPLKLSEAAQRVLDDVAQHDGKNCSVCKSVMNKNSTHDHSGEGHDSIKVSKPIPVSDRMPDPSPYNEEPTLRPSQPPAVALAAVLKLLEDELAHLKMRLALQQTALNKHDASLGKKQRKSILHTIEAILREIDMKSDQIYALYDVLEGQKENSHEMTQDEVDVTLQSIGLGRVTGKGASDYTDRLGRNDPKDKDATRAHDSEGDSDYDELPWEGFESTGDVTGRSFSRKAGKSSS
ncbi:conserved hypothetical protein [Histoplasma capsulatum G186AR]|uniref:Cep57 centrosome microtubule-binding domain-containing protein n=2 Tax=Ajellomyces capsulatus TaxID=5037 RepID=C0NNB0_AJECG|nr:uncharacterized protein HCBG_04237 [Histoplasma capsulatum G186AR]EEH07358.1 conserved hypothetical protein [Histoplasma capsulatum G186AR]KAG5304513.1 SMC (structural maintenance of chromosomes) domain-containing protein [Histoplasma capsulatum]QSS70111.1 SMC (structural maintenance of chromosomes) domain-containing protein [Histoplasma capsulatum G186AR]